MRKGDLVRINPTDPEILRLIECSSLGPVRYLSTRPTTHEEREVWRENQGKAIRLARANNEDTFPIAFDSAGESQLPPRSVSIPLDIEGIYIVERARCRINIGWHSRGGMTKILDTKTGEHSYVKRDMLIAVK